jgi:uncharacterized protein YjiS (DUF1127 family)
MSIETTIQHGAAVAWRFPATAAALLRLVRAILKAHRAENELNNLSDRDLLDIGVDRPQIGELVKRETAHATLLGTGWPRRRH